MYSGRRNEQLKFFRGKIKKFHRRVRHRVVPDRAVVRSDATFPFCRLTSFASADTRVSHRTLISRKVITPIKSPAGSDFQVDIES